VTNPDIWSNYSGVVGQAAFNSLNHFDDCLLESECTDYGLLNDALIKARVKMKRTDVNLGVAFAERKATANLLGDTATKLGKSFSALKKGQVRKAMNLLGISSKKGEPRGSNAPNKWLELQYGWKPLLSDVYGAAKALEGRDPSDWRVTSKAAVKGSPIIRTFQWTFGQAGFMQAQALNKAYCRIDALPENAGTIALTSLGITNPALIIWELVPYSFVVDWALPVGAWLESLDVMLGYESAYTSTSLFSEAAWDGVGKSESYLNVNFINKYKESKRLKYLQRDAASGIPMPTFPRIKDPRSLGHMANGLSLLAGAFGRKSFSQTTRI